MVWNPGDIREGMPVLGLDGAEVGTVVAVHQAPARPGQSDDLSRMAHGAAQGLMDVESPTQIADLPGYFEVEAVPDSGAGRLFVPFERVQILFPGENVTLSSTGAECAALYARRPAAPIAAP